MPQHMHGVPMDGRRGEMDLVAKDGGFLSHGVTPKNHLGLSENRLVPLHPMVLDHYPVSKWLFHWEYTQHFQTYQSIFIGSTLW